MYIVFMINPHTQNIHVHVHLHAIMNVHVLTMNFNTQNQIHTQSHFNYDFTLYYIHTCLDHFTVSHTCRSHNLIKKLPIQITDTNFAQQHIIVDRLLQGHLHLAQGDVLKEIFQQQKVDVSQTLDKILTNVLEVVKMTGDRDSDQAVGGPAQRHTVELLLKLALYLMDDVS